MCFDKNVQHKKIYNFASENLFVQDKIKLSYNDE